MSPDVVATLRAERQRQGLSMHALGEIFGASASSVHDWEHGVHVPTLTSLRAWAGALGYDVALIVIAHEFTEDVNDASMCLCGVPALTHDQVYPPGCTRQIRTLQDTYTTCGGGDPRCPECNPPSVPPGPGSP